MYQVCDFSGFFLQESPFASKFSWKKRSSHQGENEVACIVSKPLVSCLWGCGESVNPPKLNIQEVQRILSSRPKGRPRPATHLSGTFSFVKHLSLLFHSRIQSYLQSIQNHLSPEMQRIASTTHLPPEPVIIPPPIPPIIPPPPEMTTTLLSNASTTITTLGPVTHINDADIADVWPTRFVTAAKRTHPLN